MKFECYFESGFDTQKGKFSIVQVGPGEAILAFHDIGHLNRVDEKSFTLDMADLVTDQLTIEEKIKLVDQFCGNYHCRLTPKGVKQIRKYYERKANAQIQSNMQFD